MKSVEGILSKKRLLEHFYSKHPTRSYGNIIIQLIDLYDPKNHKRPKDFFKNFQITTLHTHVLNNMF